MNKEEDLQFGGLTNFFEGTKDLISTPERAAMYLNVAAEDEDSRVFLFALKEVIDLQIGGLGNLSKLTLLDRKNLYRIFSENGNPGLNSLHKILKAINMRLKLEPISIDS